MSSTVFSVQSAVLMTYVYMLQDTPEPVGGSKDFLAFGGGLRLCVGAEFAKLQMAMFLHCLVTNYR